MPYRCAPAVLAQVHTCRIKLFQPFSRSVPLPREGFLLTMRVRGVNASAVSDEFGGFGGHSRKPKHRKCNATWFGHSSKHKRAQNPVQCKFRYRKFTHTKSNVVLSFGQAKQHKTKKTECGVDFGHSRNREYKIYVGRKR